jgi:hypothetical protein
MDRFKSIQANTWLSCQLLLVVFLGASGCASTPKDPLPPIPETRWEPSDPDTQWPASSAITKKTGAEYTAEGGYLYIGMLAVSDEKKGMDKLEAEAKKRGAHFYILNHTDVLTLTSREYKSPNCKKVVTGYDHVGSPVSGISIQPRWGEFCDDPNAQMSERRVFFTKALLYRRKD